MRAPGRLRTFGRLTLVVAGRDRRVHLDFDRDATASAQVMTSHLEAAFEVALPTAERFAAPRVERALVPPA